ISNNIYLPLFRHLDGYDEKRISKVIEISKKISIPAFVSNDVLFHVKEKRKTHDVLRCLSLKKTLKEAGDELLQNSERFLKSPEQMWKLFKDFPKEYERTLEISDRCHFSLNELRYQYPSEWIPFGETAQSYLEKLIRERL